MEFETLDGISRRMADAQKRYGPFASTHEALGVCLEEWDELKSAVQANALESVRDEALDLAAACLRLAESIRTPDFVERSGK
jgi:NTP pyrophosphatase (non-canonical NTP hydrolase)